MRRKVGTPKVLHVPITHGDRYESNWYDATPLLATATFRGAEDTKALRDCSEEGKFTLTSTSKRRVAALIEACALDR